MIPYRMLQTPPGRALQDSGAFPRVTFGHFERNYARMEGAHRMQDLNANLRRSDIERTQVHYALHRPQLTHRRPMPIFTA